MWLSHAWSHDFLPHPYLVTWPAPYTPCSVMWFNYYTLPLCVPQDVAATVQPSWSGWDRKSTVSAWKRKSLVRNWIMFFCTHLCYYYLSHSLSLSLSNSGRYCNSYRVIRGWVDCFFVPEDQLSVAYLVPLAPNLFLPSGLSWILRCPGGHAGVGGCQPQPGTPGGALGTRQQSPSTLDVRYSTKSPSPVQNVLNKYCHFPSLFAAKSGYHKNSYRTVVAVDVVTVAVSMPPISSHSWVNRENCVGKWWSPLGYV